jgi:predicted DNA-binding protein
MISFDILRAMSDNARRPHVFTITDSPRLPRELWERFKANAQARGDQTIDALRRAIELYLDQKPEPRP